MDIQIQFLDYIRNSAIKYREIAVESIKNNQDRVVSQKTIDSVLVDFLGFACKEKNIEFDLSKDLRND